MQNARSKYARRILSKIFHQFEKRKRTYSFLSLSLRPGHERAARAHAPFISPFIFHSNYVLCRFPPKRFSAASFFLIHQRKNGAATKEARKTPPFFRQWSSNGRQNKARLPEMKKTPTIKLPMKSYFLVVPEAGLEPARSCPRQILSLMRLPFRHSGALMTYCITRAEFQSIGSRTMCATSRRRAVSVWSQKMGVRVASPRCAQ